MPPPSDDDGFAWHSFGEDVPQSDRKPVFAHHCRPPRRLHNRFVAAAVWADPACAIPELRTVAIRATAAAYNAVCLPVRRLRTRAVVLG